MGNLLQLLAKQWKAIAGAIVAIMVLISLSTVLLKNHDERVIKEFAKKHDEEYAKQLATAFCEKLNEIISKHKTTIDKKVVVEEIRILCDEYALPYNTVLKPEYINN